MVAEHTTSMDSVDVEKNMANVDSSTTTSSIAASVVDIKTFGSDETAFALPPKNGHSSVTRWLNHIFFSYYRKTFSLIFFANLATFIVLVARYHGTPDATDVGSAASANLMVTLLFRQENFVNLLYEVACACPHNAPLWFRRRLAKVFHYGGAHSGAGVAAVVWFMLYTAIITKDYIAHPTRSFLPNLITAYILVAMFILILAGAYPRFRVLYHDYFEAMHRYAGWIALGTFWTHTVFAAEAYRTIRTPVLPLGEYLIKTPNFWMFCISTSCSILSWSRLRRHDVFPEVLSDHAIRLHFKYKQIKPFYGVKVSTKPALEWHAFATIPHQEDEGKGFSIIVSSAGDWTRETIRNPPQKLWVRGAPLHGLLYTSRLFERIVVVATGSGIGPTLSLFHANVTPRRIFWSASSPETTYGAKIVKAVKAADEEGRARIWDTRKEGRPDMVLETWKLVKESDAEAVFIISNMKLTRKVVFGMESRGVPAYGAIFDS
ncbi:hypothetical protein VNI00_004693 [Paramarasmius palmivorus]|uniref:Uncharacterized protein n=1 Tax=Paramarasmius palmivorus TaxID=297713 RepID=A0AAW0DHB8_9AGAR